jgi:Ca2+-binding RTX toxin-like protein
MGNDDMIGEEGDDKLYGYAGNDIITGGPGQDELNGEDGDDLIRPFDGNADIIQCGTGMDTVDGYDTIRDTISQDCEIRQGGLD